MFVELLFIYFYLNDFIILIFIFSIYFIYNNLINKNRINIKI